MDRETADKIAIAYGTVKLRARELVAAQTTYRTEATKRGKHTEKHKEKCKKLYALVLLARADYEKANDAWLAAPHPYGVTDYRPVP